MILEGLLTSLSVDGHVNLAPMGPIVDADLQSFVLRPFRSSDTYRNLRQHPQAVFHLTDDVELIARSALEDQFCLPPLRTAQQVAGSVLADCCRWFELTVIDWDDSEERARIMMQVVHAGRVRDFCGFNRAQFAVLEATILATRLHLLTCEVVQAEIQRLQPLVDKTAGPRELAAWRFVVNFVQQHSLSACSPVNSESSVSHPG